MTEADGKPRASTGHARAICVAPSVEHPPARGTMPCAPGAFSLTAPVFRSSRAQKGAWCAPHGSDGRRGHRRQEQGPAAGAGGGRWCRKAQAGTGRKGMTTRKTQAWRGRKGTMAQGKACCYKRGRLSISRPRIKGVEVFSKRQKQVAADLAKTFVDRFLFEEGVCRWHMTDERLKRLPKVMQLIFDDYLFRHIYSEAVYLA